MLVNLRTSWGHQVRNLFSSLQPFPFPREMNSGLMDMYAIVKSAENKLSVVQNRCLGKIAGAYKATPVRSLEAETYFTYFSLHLNPPQAKARENVTQQWSSQFDCKSLQRSSIQIRCRE